MKSVSVIGATGYLGSRICRLLVQAGFQVRAWGRKNPDGASDWAGNFEKFNTGDIADAVTIDRIVAEESDAIVHCLSMDHHQTEKDLDLAWNVNVRPVWQLLDRLSKRRSPSRFVYLSTSQVYGTAVGTITEASPCNPRNHYGLTHLMAENIIRRYCSEPATVRVSLRLSNGYGPPEFEDANCWWLVVNDFCRLAVEQGRIQLNSDGLQYRNFVHVDDICRSVEMMLNLTGSHLDQPAYNVGGAQSIAILDLAHRVSEIYGNMVGKKPPVCLPGGVISEPRTVAEYTGTLDYSITAITRLGYNPSMKLDDGIRQLLQSLTKRSDR